MTFDEIAVLLKLREEFAGLTVAQLARFLRKKLCPKASKKEIQKKVHHILDNLEKEGLVKTETIGNYRFAKITLEGIRFIREELPEWSKRAEVDSTEFSFFAPRYVDDL